MIGPLLLTLLTAPEPPSARFVFRDEAVHDGRSVLAFRPVPLRPTPIRPLRTETPPGPGALYGLALVGSDLDAALAVVWEPNAPGGPRLWLDADGDGRLTPAECHTLPTKEIEVPATFTVAGNGGPQRLRRTLIFRRSTLGDGLSYAVRGYAMGTLTLAGKPFQALLTDGNADGCFDGAGTDRLWIDLNGDGRFDGLTEQFLLGSPVAAAGQIYIVKSDATAGQVRAYQRTREQGTARLSLTGTLDRSARNVSVQLVSDIGELITLENLERPAALPAGKYRLGGLRFRLTDTRGRTWSYRFAGGGPYKLHVVPGKETSLVLLADLALKVQTSASAGGVDAGESFDVRPALDNPLGVFLAECSVCESEAVSSRECAASIRLLTPQGRAVAQEESGFH